MTTYYKATRPDGTDFRTGTVDYGAALLSGEILTHSGQNGLIPDRASTYFSVSSKPHGTLIGGAWPCRLFLVEIGPDALKSRSHRDKWCSQSVRVLEELEPWMALGPNGREVSKFIEEIPGHFQGIDRDADRDAAWDAAWHAARDAAWHAARDAVWDAGRDSAWHAARNAVWDSAWRAARIATWGSAWGSAWDPAWDAAGDSAWGAARYSARYSVCAIVVRDLISVEHFDELTYPWRILTGEIDA